MQEAPATEVSAAKAREHLIAFVEEMVAGLPHVRQRKNALLYVRGLIEHGGRKSLQPTLLRLGENAARYESVQQFLADSPWDAGLLVRACAERVTAELGLAAWLVDDTGGSSAAESVRFGVDGVGFEIDLSAENAAYLRRAFSPWMRSASIRGVVGRV